MDRPRRAVYVVVVWYPNLSLHLTFLSGRFDGAVAIVLDPAFKSREVS